MRLVSLASLALVLGTLAGSAGADEGEEKAPLGSHFTLAFAGGAVLPNGDMEGGADPSLDVSGRFGWNGTSGLGLVVNVDYALLRRNSVAGAIEPVAIDAHMLSATAMPRFTLGKKVFRLWIAAGGGVLFEKTTASTSEVERTYYATVPAWGGSAGLDLHFFANGGLSLAGAYTRSLDNEYDFISVNAGLVFVM
jgi:hypothetical protein